ncbi:MAG TPA: Fur family transcriptional regulator [Chthoniobacterales bacterium]|jgi:Fe2+ or Zn2+ uptake regulation protein|nr:Fur family transcriptional regulator [Chthoniobacterales bacterium]
MRQHSSVNRSPLKVLSLQTIVDFLRAHGMRVTKNRTSILQTMLTAEKPLSLNEIHDRASTKACAPDFATVFRALNLFEKLRIAQKVNLNQSCSHYELLNPTRHCDHVVCTECGKVIVIVNKCPVRNAQRQIEKQYGFSDLHHSLEFFGKCPDCNCN